MKNYISISLLFFFLIPQSEGQVQEVIDDLVGSYAAYLVTDACHQPPVIPLVNLLLDVHQIGNTDTIIFKESADYGDTTYIDYDTTLVQLIEDSNGIYVNLETNNPAGLLDEKLIIGPDSLLFRTGLLCLACHCHYLSYFEKTGPTNVSQPTKSVDFKIFPNPTQHHVYIEATKNMVSSKTTLSILDFSGQVVFRQNISTQSTEVNIAHLPTGCYVVKIQESDKIFTERLIKMN